MEQAEGFRILLQNTLVQRCQKNTAYSLRAFAKSLGLSHSALSEILKKKRPITPKMMLRLGYELGLTPKQLQTFTKISDPTCAPFTPALDPQTYTLINTKELEALSEWYCIAIWEWLATNKASTDTNKIAKVFGISQPQVQSAIEKLIHFKLVEIKNGKLKRTQVNRVSYTDHTGTSGIRKNLQRQFFDKARAAIDEVPFEHRYHAGVTMSIDSSKLEKAKELILSYNRKLRNILGDSKNLDQVYHLSVALFPLTNNYENKKEK